jgi:SAM-dependent methyltransferase
VIAPGVPADYHDRIFAVEESHWWHRGMREITAALLGGRLRPGAALLDAGCGTGGFLRWAVDSAGVEPAGFDISAAGIELARRRVPEAELRVSPVSELPFDSGAFDIVTLNDVLQHIPQEQMDASLGQLRRVLSPDGALLVRTGGARRARQERDDWRIYDRGELRATLERGGFRCERVTHVNVLGSLAAAVRGRSPRAPTEESDGIPAPVHPATATVGRLSIRAELTALSRSRVSLPYGHTLFALAAPRGG